ncbi:MAG: DNA-processing protein DprA [Candidatus Binatia bacterium]
MVSKTTEITQESALYPAGLHRFFEISPPRLWCMGEPGILNKKLLGIISSRKIEPDLALKAAELLKQLACLEGTFISGWHSPLEEEALRILLDQPSRIVFCLSKSLNKFIPHRGFRSGLAKGGCYY